MNPKTHELLPEELFFLSQFLIQSTQAESDDLVPIAAKVCAQAIATGYQPFNGYEADSLANHIHQMIVSGELTTNSLDSELDTSQDWQNTNSVPVVLTAYEAYTVIQYLLSVSESDIHQMVFRNVAKRLYSKFVQANPKYNFIQWKQWNPQTIENLLSN